MGSWFSDLVNFRKNSLERQRLQEMLESHGVSDLIDVTTVLKSTQEQLNSVNDDMLKARTSLSEVVQQVDAKRQELGTLASVERLKKYIEDTTKQVEAKRHELNTLVEVESLKKYITNTTQLVAQKRKELGILNSISDLHQVYKDTERQLLLKIDLLKAALKDKTAEIDAAIARLIVLDDELAMESFALYKPKFQFSDSSAYKHRLDTIRSKQKDMLKTKTATSLNQAWTVNGSKKEGAKMSSDMSKLLLRAFNTECDNSVANVKFNTMESNKSRIQKSFDALNKSGEGMGVAIAQHYLNLKIEELYLSFEYQQKKQDEREELKMRNEELREQAKVAQELERIRDKIEKERRHLANALSSIETKLSTVAVGEAEYEALIEQKEKYLAKDSELNAEEAEVEYREKNAKAGYVYVISNLGAFGEGVYKIGMTRRLEPQDRVDELGGASVPFRFDTHALIFSEDAPALESKLHHHFHKSRVNKLNNRKEFFKADIHEIERVIRENYAKVFDMVHVATAEQYRESLRQVD